MDKMWLAVLAGAAIVAGIVVVRLLTEGFKWLAFRNLTEEEIKEIEDDPARLIW